MWICNQMYDTRAPAGAASGPSALRAKRNSNGQSIERLRPFKGRARLTNVKKGKGG
jgi:hypothetical protein